MSLYHHLLFVVEISFWGGSITQANLRRKRIYTFIIEILKQETYSKEVYIF